MEIPQKSSKGKKKSRTPGISEERFGKLLKAREKSLIEILSVLANQELILNKKYFFSLLHEAEKLEEFFYDHGAKKNARWVLYAELVACTRNYAFAGFHISHVVEKYHEYMDEDEIIFTPDFKDLAYDALDYILSVLLKFYKEILLESETERVDHTAIDDEVNDWKLSVIAQLPHTIEGADEKDNREKMISIAEFYREILSSYKRIRISHLFGKKDLSELLPKMINETLLSKFEGDLHNIQSEYDTYVNGSRLEKEYAEVARFRGFIALPMHMFKAMIWFIHFYERHSKEMRPLAIKEKISSMVSREKLFDLIANFGLKYIQKYLIEGNALAEKILSALVIKKSISLPQPQPNGFHARPATYLALVAKEYGVELFIILDDKKYDCRSVLEVMEAGALLVENLDQEVVFEGDEKALNDLKVLSECNWGDNQDIPKELNYLRISRNI